MANNRSVYYIDAKFNINDSITKIQQLEQKLRELNKAGKIQPLSDLQQSTKDIATSITNLKTRMQQGFKTPNEINKFESRISETDVKIKSLIEDLKNLKLSDFDLSSIDETFAELTKKSKELSQSLNAAKNTKISVESKSSLPADMKKQLTTAQSRATKEVNKLGGKSASGIEAATGGDTKGYISKVMGNYKPEESDTKAMEVYNKILDAEVEKLEKILTTKKQIQENDSKKNTRRTELTEGKDSVVGTMKAEAIENLSGQSQNLDSLHESAEKAMDSLNRSKEASKNIEQLVSRLKYLTGISGILMTLRGAFQGIKRDIKELDDAFNEISVVTGKTMTEMWNSFSKVNKIAQEYGVTTKGVVEVQNLYYHQGLNDVEVTQLTTETLKLAKIASLEYGDATDKLTAALNAFNIEAEDASRITDVTAALASSAAADSKEIMNALTKTASISASAGTSFENTEVFLTKMIETTRESSENLGTALKTITARFTELKTATDSDEDGEIADFNKVDTALKSVGISLKDASGQMRDFDDIIMELSSKWDTLDRNTQRY